MHRCRGGKQPGRVPVGQGGKVAVRALPGGVRVRRDLRSNAPRRHNWAVLGAFGDSKWMNGLTSLGAGI